jgi:hypothetical protein
MVCWTWDTYVLVVEMYFLSLPAHTFAISATPTSQHLDHILVLGSDTRVFSLDV